MSRRKGAGARRIGGFLTLALAALVLAFMVWRKSAMQEPALPITEPAATSSPSAPEATASSVVPATPSATPDAADPSPSPAASGTTTTNAARDMRTDERSARKLSPPALSTVREEVAADPHGKPPSLTRFSQEMADRIEAARADPALVPALFTDLEGCVGQPSGQGVTSVQAYCLINASRLARENPELAPRYSKLRAAASPEVLRLARLSEELSR